MVIVTFCISVVLLAFSESEYTTSEDADVVSVCVVMQAPTGGLECDILVTLGLQDGPEAGILS